MLLYIPVKYIQADTVEIKIWEFKVYEHVKFATWLYQKISVLPKTESLCLKYSDQNWLGDECKKKYFS